MLLLSIASAGGALASPAKCYDWIAKEKLRGGYVAANDPRESVQRMKAIGMNAVLPKFGGLTNPPDEGNLKYLREWGEASRKAGLRLIPVFNFRGGETEKILSNRREVTPSGQRMERTPCPLDEQFWQSYILGRAVYLAEQAKAMNIAGVIIDPEMYGADHTVFNGVCYCDDCLREFLKATGEALPDPFPAPADREGWLKEHQLTDQFQRRFIDRVKGFCQQIEREVHGKNPEFLIGVFLLDYPLSFMRGMAEGLGTEKHPVLAFSETTYSPGYTPYVLEQQKTFASFPSHTLFIPGLWIHQFPTENIAEQVYACAKDSAGYWIYTFESLVEDVSNLPGYALPEPDARYWAAMQVANQELDKWVDSGGRYEPSLKVRAFDPPFAVLVAGNVKSEPLISCPDTKPLSLGAEALTCLRYRNPLFILAKAGEPIEVKVTNRQLNPNYRPGTQFIVLDPGNKKALDGRMKVNQNASAKWTPDMDGVYVLLAESGNNGHVLQVVTRQPFAFKASDKQRLTVQAILGKLYFYVPSGVEKFSFFVQAEGHIPGRGGKFTVYSPDGQIAAKFSGDFGTTSELPVNVPAAMQGKVWALTGEDITNEIRLWLSPNMPPFVSTDGARLLVDPTHQGPG